MVRTWIADVSALREEEVYLKYHRYSAPERKEKADRLMRMEDKALSIGAGILLEEARQRCGVDESAVYNLSHSGKHVMCSIEDSGNPDVKVGCDLEAIGEVRMGVAKRFFCPSEYEMIAKQKTKAEQAELFYRYWVLKESFMKATRKGMALGLSEFEIDLTAGETPVLIRIPEEIKGSFFYKEYRSDQIKAKMAVCSTNPDMQEDLTEVLLFSEKKHFIICRNMV